MTCLGVLPQHVIESYLQAQSLLMQESLAGRKTKSITTEMQLSMQTRRAQFNTAQHAVFLYWQRRLNIPPQAMGNNHIVANWLREGEGEGTGRTSVLREWEDTKRIKLSNV